MADRVELAIAEVLNRAADLIKAPGAWTQGTYARGKSGKPVETRRSAVCFCLIGAIDYVEGYEPGLEGNVRALDAVRDVIPDDKSIAEFNDTPGRTQAEAVATLRAAALRSQTVEDSRG